MLCDLILISSLHETKLVRFLTDTFIYMYSYTNIHWTHARTHMHIHVNPHTRVRRLRQRRNMAAGMWHWLLMQLSVGARDTLSKCLVSTCACARRPRAALRHISRMLHTVPVYLTWQYAWTVVRSSRTYHLFIWHWQYCCITCKVCTCAAHVQGVHMRSTRVVCVLEGFLIRGIRGTAARLVG